MANGLFDVLFSLGHLLFLDSTLHHKFFFIGEKLELSHQDTYLKLFHQRIFCSVNSPNVFTQTRAMEEVGSDPLLGRSTGSHVVDSSIGCLSVKTHE